MFPPGLAFGRRVGGTLFASRWAVFNLLHEGFALEEVALAIGGKLTRHDEDLIVDDFGERDGAAAGGRATHSRDVLKPSSRQISSVPDSLPNRRISGSECSIVQLVMAFRCIVAV